MGVHAWLSEVGRFGLSSRARFTAARAMSKSGLFGPVKEMSRDAPIISFNPCVAARVRTAMSVRGRRVVGAGIRLLFCRWCVGRRAYDVDGLALEALRVPGATVPRGPQRDCQGHDEHRDEGQRHGLSQEVKSSEALHCARERALIGYSEYSRGVP